VDTKQMRARVKAITKGFRTDGVKKVDTDKDSLAYKVGTLLGSSGHARQIAEAFALVTDLDILTPYTAAVAARNKNGDGFVCKFMKPLVAVVPTHAYGGHNYPVNRPLILGCAGVNYAGFMENGMPGNNITPTAEGQLRLATDEEIDKLTDAQLNALILEYTA
jgi:hypothetical protein